MKERFSKTMPRAIALMLACVMLLMCFVSCGKDDGDGKDSSSNTVQAGSDSSRLPLTVQKEDNGGKEFTIYINSQHTNDLLGDMSTRVSQIRHQINDSVEDLLGIEIVYEEALGDWSNRKTFNNAIETMALSDSSEYDIVWANMSSTLPTTMLKGLYMDVNEIDSMKTDSPWYIKNMQNEYALNGKLYGVIGDASFTLYEQMEVVFYNKDLLADYKIDDPIEKVESGEWYMEDLFESAKNIVSTDADTYTGALGDDSVGLLWDCVAGRYITTAWNLSLVERDNTGKVYIAESPAQHLVDVFDYIFDKIDNSGGTVITPGDRATITDNFNSGKVAFALTYLGLGSIIKEASFEYSIVPVPKIDEDQSDFVTAVGSSVASIMVLKNVKDAELSGKVIEAFSYYSHYDGVPQFYDVILKLQYAKDAQFGETLDMIREKAELPFSVVFSTELKPRLTEIFQMNEEYRTIYIGASLPTFWAGNKGSWRGALDGIYEAVDQLG